MQTLEQIANYHYSREAAIEAAELEVTALTRRLAVMDAFLHENSVRTVGVARMSDGTHWGTVSDPTPFGIDKPFVEKMTSDISSVKGERLCKQDRIETWRGEIAKTTILFASLTDNEQAFLRLRYRKGMTYKDIAEKIGCSVDALEDWERALERDVPIQYRALRDGLINALPRRKWERNRTGKERRCSVTSQALPGL